MTGFLSKRTTHTLLAAVIAIGFLWRLWFSWRDSRLLVTFPLVDDSFYALNIARNIALGKGLTHDGVNITNGFQPLFVFLSVPVYYLLDGDKLLSINVVLTLSAILSCFTALLTYKIVRHLSSEKPALFAAFFWALSPTVIEHEINGLETGLAIFFLAWTTWYYLSRIRCDKEAGGKQYAILGVFCGLAILSRIDNGLLLIALTVDILWMSIRSGKEIKEYFRNLVIFGLVCGIVISPWFLSNLFGFGAIMPDSGQAVRFLSMSPTASRYHAAGENIDLNNIPWGYYIHNMKMSFTKLNRTPFLQTAMWLGLIFSLPGLGLFFSFAVMTGIVFLLFIYRKSLLEYIQKMPRLTDANWLILYSALIVSGYTFYVFCQWFYPRYYFPVTWVSILYSAVFIDFLADQVFVKHSRKIIVLFAVFFLVIFSVRSLEKVLERAEINKYYDVAVWVDQNLEKGAVVGMFQSGAGSYFAGQTVINLDGVVNSKAYQAMREKRMMSYLISERVQYVVDWEWMIDDYLRKCSDSTLVESSLKLFKKDIIGVNVYKIAPP
jgi:4-amino-4-deoxy-L-arabinose transferase-like glycosyltransferase